MSPRRSGRTQACDRADARVRLTHARAYLEVAQLVADNPDDPAQPSVAAALAVLAGIAAADSACCAALGERSRGADHREAQLLVARIEPGGREAAKQLLQLLDLKDTAHYGLTHLTDSKLTAALRRAEKLVAFAERVVEAG
jgi:hypothetical protein